MNADDITKANDYAKKALAGALALTDVQQILLNRIRGIDAKRNGINAQIQEVDKARVALEAQVTRYSGAMNELGEMLYELRDVSAEPPKAMPPSSETAKSNGTPPLGKSITHLSDAD